MPDLNITEKINFLEKASIDGLDAAYAASPLTISHDEFKALQTLNTDELTKYSELIKKMSEAEGFDPLSEVTGIIGF